MPKICDLRIDKAHVATMNSAANRCAVPYGAIESASVAIGEGKILWVGEAQQCDFQGRETLDAKGAWLLPGLIDCHTHIIYAGNRSEEFEQRLQGLSYSEIARQGGGIRHTVNATRAASEDELLKLAIRRAKRLLREGVTCIEIKSGYGLDLDTEAKMLKVARALERHLPITVQTTYLGAHAVPPEYDGDADGYIDFVCNTAMPALSNLGLVDAVDVFCESIGFTPQQSQRVWQKATSLGLPFKGHVEQLTDQQGAVLASAHGALSVDHIEYLSPEDVPKIKEADSVAVLLPAAFYYLHELQKPPIQALREASVPMAVATDSNPGSSPILSLLTAMNMACVLFGLTPEEALRGTTANAARALGLGTKGKIAVGMDADFGLWDICHPSELAYGIHQVEPKAIWHRGQHVSAN